MEFIAFGTEYAVIAKSYDLYAVGEKLMANWQTNEKKNTWNKYARAAYTNRGVVHSHVETHAHKKNGGRKNWNAFSKKCSNKNFPRFFH